MLVFDTDRLSWLNIHFIMVARTFGHGDTDPIFIQVEALGARTAVHGQEVGGAALLIRAQ